MKYLIVIVLLVLSSGVQAWDISSDKYPEFNNNEIVEAFCNYETDKVGCDYEPWFILSKSDTNNITVGDVVVLHDVYSDELLEVEQIGYTKNYIKIKTSAFNNRWIYLSNK